MVQNFDGKNTDKFNKFSAIHQYFTYKISYFITTDEYFCWLSAPLKMAAYETPWKCQSFHHISIYIYSSPSLDIVGMLYCITVQYIISIIKNKWIAKCKLLPRREHNRRSTHYWRKLKRYKAVQIYNLDQLILKKV